VRKRLDGDNGMSFTEFTYQLVQGYDFYYLFDTKGIKLQMGGSDQWGNIVTGTELIRRKSQGEAFAFTCPLITRADGGKFGKSEKGNVWLDPAKTSPYQFYQFWLNASDEDAVKWIKIFTLLPPDIIDPLIEQHQQQPSERLLQKKLAEEVTRFIHGEAGLEQAIQTTEKLFSRVERPITDFSKEDLEQLEGVTKVSFERSFLAQGIPVIQILTDTGIFPSKGEARKMIQNGGVSLNKEKIKDQNELISDQNLLHSQYLLVQKGKKHYFLIEVE
jgi:tyrosyl-tRNA synthetase